MPRITDLTQTIVFHAYDLLYFDMQISRQMNMNELLNISINETPDRKDNDLSAWFLAVIFSVLSQTCNLLFLIWQSHNCNQYQNFTFDLIHGRS